MKGVFSKAQLFLKRSSPTILTCIGAAGVVATAVLAVKATPKAMALLEKTKEEKGEELTKLEVVKTAGPAYIPAIATGAGTIMCMFGANVLNKRQQASLISAYGVLEASYKEYKKKVIELFGEDGHTKVLSGITKDHYEEHTIPAPEGKQTFMDFYSLQFFDSTMGDIEYAQQVVNDILQSRGYALLSEYYDALGIACSEYDYDMAWTKGMCDRIEFDHETITMENGEQCCVISMVTEPMPGF